FLALCLYGEHQPHRSFTHSLAGVAMLGTAVFIMLPQAVWYFVCGMATHIFLDLWNRKKVQLLFPFDAGKICFRLCSADGVVNRVLFWTGFFLLIGESIWAAVALLHHSGWLPF
ncbi:MAG: metal-dependent hydrolase, partial [Oscillospiraceae bacterium]|nr:metal-dependent hydrolase [Oscillospiraceae bacterium]MDY2510993.1 metal-dependent hydrolase [Ruminococcus callidus]